MQQDRTVYVGLLEGLATTLATGGRVFDAFTALTFVQWVAQSAQQAAGAAGFLEMVDVEMALLQACLRSESDMVQFLKRSPTTPTTHFPSDSM